MLSIGSKGLFSLILLALFVNYPRKAFLVCTSLFVSVLNKAVLFHSGLLFFSHVNSYRIYSINHPGRLLNLWSLRVGAYSRLGAY